MNRAGISAVLSFLIPGLGQIYNGDFFRGLLWFVVALFIGITLSPLSMGLTSVLYHLVCAWAAFRRAELREGSAPVHLPRV